MNSSLRRSHPSPMDSQLTLVDTLTGTPSPPGLIDHLILRFSEDDVHNTEITVGDEDLCVRYTVESDAHASSTRITKIIPAHTPVTVVVGIVHRWSIFPDTIQLGDFTMAVKKWLKTPTLSHIPATFSVNERSFTWKRQGLDQLALRCSEEGETDLIAWVTRSSVRSVSRQDARHATTIYLRKKAEDIIDEVILSFLVLEHRLRAVQRAKEAKEAAIGGPAGGVPMFLLH